VSSARLTIKRGQKDIQFFFDLGLALKSSHYTNEAPAIGHTASYFQDTQAGKDSKRRTMNGYELRFKETNTHHQRRGAAARYSAGWDTDGGRLSGLVAATST